VTHTIQTVISITIAVVISFSIPVTLLVLTDRLGARPARWLGRARMFLIAIRSAIQRNVPVEQALIELAEKGDTEMGVEFHALAAWLNTGLPLHEALAKVPRFLPRSIQALLIHGSRTGKLRELMPVGQSVMNSLSGPWRPTGAGLLSPLTITIAFVGVAGILSTFVVPKFIAIFSDMGGERAVEVMSGFLFIWNNFDQWLQLHFAVVAIMIVCNLFFMGGPAVAQWMQHYLPRLTDFVYRLFPWQRLEQQRRFGLLLSHLLDAGIPEEPALLMSGDFAGNRWFKARVIEAAKALREGEGLIAALKHVDPDPDFQFRLETARRSNSSFREALADWSEALRARAQFREAAAANVAYTTFLCYNAVCIGFVGVSFFAAEIELIDIILTW